MNNENTGKILKEEKISFLAHKIKEGCVVGIPTDTVYGIAAGIYDKNATNRIYKIKNRPKSKPLIAFVDNSIEIEDLVEEIPPFAIKLMDKFWPGALTLIFKASERVPCEVRAGKDTIGIRVPDCRVVLDLLKILKEPLAVTSANISEKEEIFTAEKVLEELGKEIDFILDGGITRHRCVSTIVDVTEGCPVMIRNGKIKKEQLEEVVANIYSHGR